MGRKFYLPLVVLILFGFSALAQTGEIRGKVTEKGGKEGIPFASVAAFSNGAQIQAAVTDFDGNFVIKPLPPGKYDVKATTVGYQPSMRTGVLVTVDKASFVDFELGKGVELKTVEVVEYTVPLIDKGSPATQKTITYQEIQAAPTRDVNTVASTTAGVYQQDEGKDLNIRGARSDATVYFVDGVKVRGNLSLPQKGTEQITVITGGVPAQYGDVAGGVISVTTRGPSNTFGGGVEYLTSQFLDPYGFNLGSFNVTGPIYTKKDTAGNKQGQAVAGFFLAGEYQYEKDPNPPAIKMYKVKDEVLDFARQNPLVLSPVGEGFIHRSYFYTLDSFETQKYRENVSSKNWRLTGKLDFRPFKDFTVTLGGNYARNDRHDFIDIYSLMNFDNNPQTIETNWRAFAKITHRLGGEMSKEKASSVIQNAYYTLQADYSNSHSVSQNDVHKDRVFDYGYVGKFQTYSTPFYFPVAEDSIPLIGYFDTLTTFTPGPQNPNTAAYTSQYYNLTAPLGTFGYTDNIFNVQQNALINGDNRVNLNVNGLWATPGRTRSFYGVSDQTQARLIGSFSADIKKHNIIVGFEIEQRTDRGFSVNPNNLWAIMRNLGNFNLKGPDVSSAVQLGGDTVTFTRAQYVQSQNTDGEFVRGFFENVRDKLGKQYYDTIQTDALDPSFYSLSMFSPDELLNSGNSLVNYFGYDYTGKVDKSSNWDLNDFFVKKDANNNFIRRVDAFRPVYYAGYIQDKFTFNDIIFNIGVRVDRFDANQRVLKDQYLLYDTYKAGDSEIRNRGWNVPSSIGSDYYVYVNNSESPTQIVGYRNGNTWYNASGAPITDLTSLIQGSGNSGGIQPFLKNYNDFRFNRVNPNAFKDYEPQVNVMPRIAFSFPISDEAYFAAHYDILTQRPQDPDLIRFNPISYLSWAQNQSGTFSNPDLKPERTTNYEINFQQKLSRSSAFGISAFYSERRNNIQIINLDYAFPIRYSTYGNIDFGTVKGLTFNYDLRRTANVRMNISYTLQFAEGTGSDPNANSGILSTQGQTNLREIKPLNFDQRHTFVTSFDYHYGSGRDYNGPVWGNKQIFANAGLNLVFRAGSGTPYTRKNNITPEADFTTTANSRSQISGQLNGSRYPWQFRIDARVDKDFNINAGTKANGDKRSFSANIYLQVLNVLNTQNIISVYRATGSPDDDGYLNTPAAQVAIAQKVSPQAYIDQYRIALNNPGNYSLPRRIRLGIMLNF